MSRSIATPAPNIVAPDHGPFPIVYVVVNSDLRMSLQTLCQQCCHAVSAMTRSLEVGPTPTYRQWLSGVEQTVVVQISEKDMRSVVTSCAGKQRIFPVYDPSLLQAHPGALMALAFEPLEQMPRLGNWERI